MPTQASQLIGQSRDLPGFRLGRRGIVGSSIRPPPRTRTREPTLRPQPEPCQREEAIGRRRRTARADGEAVLLELVAAEVRGAPATA